MKKVIFTILFAFEAVLVYQIMHSDYIQVEGIIDYAVGIFQGCLFSSIGLFTKKEKETEDVNINKNVNE